MRFTRPVLAALCIANAVRSADPRADESGTLAQESQTALKESGQVSPNFRDAKTDEERKKAVETTDQPALREVGREISQRSARARGIDSSGAFHEFAGFGDPDVLANEQNCFPHSGQGQFDRVGDGALGSRSSPERETWSRLRADALRHPQGVRNISAQRHAEKPAQGRAWPGLPLLSPVPLRSCGETRFVRGTARTSRALRGTVGQGILRFIAAEGTSWPHQGSRSSTGASRIEIW